MSALLANILPCLIVCRAYYQSQGWDAPTPAVYERDAVPVPVPLPDQEKVDATNGAQDVEGREGESVSGVSGFMSTLGIGTSTGTSTGAGAGAGGGGGREWLGGIFGARSQKY